MDEPERLPVTEEQRRRSAEAIAQLKRDIAAAKRRPPPVIHNPDKFTEPPGLDADGNFQPPLTPEERAHNEEVRRRGASGG